MNKKISSELAVGIILLIAIAVSGVFWVMNRKETVKIQQHTPSVVANATDTAYQGSQPVAAVDSCKPHYYEGEATVRAYPDAKSDNSSGLAVQIKKEDISKLPVSNANLPAADLTATLIDPTDQVKADLQTATAAKPALVTIRGYAENCQTYPQLSIKQASIAFKKS